MSCDIMWCVMSCDVMWCHMRCDVMWCVMPCEMSCHVMSCDVMYIMLWLWCHFWVQGCELKGVFCLPAHELPQLHNLKNSCHLISCKQIISCNEPTTLAFTDLIIGYHMAPPFLQGITTSLYLTIHSWDNQLYVTFFSDSCINGMLFVYSVVT